MLPLVSKVLQNQNTTLIPPSSNGKRVLSFDVIIFVFLCHHLLKFEKGSYGNVRTYSQLKLFTGKGIWEIAGNILTLKKIRDLQSSQMMKMLNIRDRRGTHFQFWWKQSIMQRGVIIKHYNQTCLNFKGHSNFNHSQAQNTWHLTAGEVNTYQHCLRAWRRRVSTEPPQLHN